MNIKVTSPSLPGGWDYYCDGCDLYFSVQADKPLDIKHCPVCGWDALVKNRKEFDQAYPHHEARAS